MDVAIGSTSNGNGVVQIQRGLPEHLREEGVLLFEEAFGDKMRTAVPDRDTRLRFMARVYAADRIVAATRDGGLLGMMGLSSGSGRYRGGLVDVPLDPRPFRDLLGWGGAMRAVAGLWMADHRPTREELYVDGVAVVAEARGQGIGTRMMDEAAAIARENGKRWLRLDVISSNPRAQALYERLGYRVTNVTRTRWMARWMGYDAIISMERAVEAGPKPAAAEAGSPLP